MDLINRVKYGKIVKKNLFQENKDFYLKELENLTDVSAKICFWWVRDLPISRDKGWTEIAQNVSGEELVRILKLIKDFENSPWEVVLRKKNNQKYYGFKYSIGKDFGSGYFNAELRIFGNN